MLKRLLIGGAFVLVWALTLAVAFVLGAIVGQLQLYRQRYQDELRIVRPLLESDEAFSGVEVGERSNGGVWILGKVPKPDDQRRLGEQLEAAFGESHAEDLMEGVSVADQEEESSGAVPGC